MKTMTDFRRLASLTYIITVNACLLLALLYVAVLFFGFWGFLGWLVLAIGYGHLAVSEL